jgi:Sodium:sulfate symporter transmembrane region
MEMETREREERREGRFTRDGEGDGLQRRTYRTLDEQEGRLSEAEQRFERRRRTLGLFLGPIVFAVMLLIPFDLDGNQHRLAAILAFVIVWWLTEAIPIPVTALLGVVLCALLEATPPPPEGDSSVDVVFGLFTDDTIFLFIGSFIIAQSLSSVLGIGSARSCTDCTEGSPSACSACARWAAPPSASSWPSG